MIRDITASQDKFFGEFSDLLTKIPHDVGGIPL
jgi:hypothetical protein